MVAVAVEGNGFDDGVGNDADNEEDDETVEFPAAAAATALTLTLDGLSDVVDVVVVMV